MTIEYRRASGRRCVGHLDYLVVHYADTGLKPAIVDVKTQSELIKRWDDLEPRFRAACEHAHTNGMLYHIRNERRIRTPFFYSVRGLLRYLRDEPDDRYESIFMGELSRNGRATFQGLLDRCFKDREERLQAATTLWILIAHQKVYVDFHNASLDDANFLIAFEGLARENTLDISRGALVESHGRLFRITNDALGFEQVQALDLTTGRRELLAIRDLRQPSNAESQIDGDARGSGTQEAEDLALFDEPRFAEAANRKNVIDAFLATPKRTREEAKKCAAELGISVTSFYRWIESYRIDDRTSTLAPIKRDGGRGKSRLNPAIESLVEIAIKQHHNTPRKRRVSATYRYLKQLCRRENIKAPLINTLRARIKSLDQETYLRERGDSKRARERFTPRPGHYDEAKKPLDVVQIDHTQLDIMLVDEETRLPLKCPWLTVVFDVYSRMVLGFYVSFDSPGMYGTGLSLYRAILRKDEWLARLGVDREWPCWGFPVKVHCDNAREFRGDVLKKACQQYGMTMAYRALKRPEYGGHIERWLGTFNEEIHELPGKRLKPNKIGDHDLKADAAYTISELEYHIALYITGVYNQNFHSGINSSPIQRWKAAIEGDGKKPPMGLPRLPLNEQRLRLDLMPFEERSIQRYGIQIGDVRYYDDALRRYVGRKPAFRTIVRYDPRDMRSVYLWDPELNKYFEIGYSNISRPCVSLWELRAVRNHLRDKGRSEIDEELIFKTYDLLREHQEAAERRRRSRAPI